MTEHYYGPHNEIYISPEGDYIAIDTNHNGRIDKDDLTVFRTNDGLAGSTIDIGDTLSANYADEEYNNRFSPLSFDKNLLPTLSRHHLDGNALETIKQIALKGFELGAYTDKKVPGTGMREKDVPYAQHLVEDMLALSTDFTNYANRKQQKRDRGF